MTQNLWDAAKAVLRGKFMAIQSNRQPNFTPKITRKRRTKNQS